MILPKLDTSGAKRGVEVIWEPWDFHWFDFTDSHIPTDKLDWMSDVCEKFQPAEVILEVMKVQNKRIEIYLDALENRLCLASPTWWKNLSDRGRKAFLVDVMADSVFRGWTLKQPKHRIYGITQADFYLLLSTNEWKEEYMTWSMPWTDVVES